MNDAITKSGKIDGRTKAGRLARQQAQPSGMSIDETPEIQVSAPLRRTSPRPAPERPAPREQMTRANPRRGAAVVTGRDGEVLTRRAIHTGDKFEIPQHEIPSGWDYQWNTVTVHNQEAVSYQLQMHANGWRPVPAERHPGRWTPTGFSGAIVVDGLRLEERPKELGDEARAEDTARAKAQIRDQTDSLRLTEKMPTGMEINGKYRGTGADVRLSIDPGMDIPRPAHETE